MKLDDLETILQDDGIVFLTYGGFLTQSLIAGMTNALEQEVENNEMALKVSSSIYTIFIELAQNMMNYSKSHIEPELQAKGLIVVGSSAKGSSYYIVSRNVIDERDRIKIQSRLEEIEGLDKEQLRTLYREKRKSAKDTHEKGAGIGFIEIARRCDKIEHAFERINDNRYYFTLKTTIFTEKEG